MEKKKLNNYKRIQKANSTKPRKQYKNKMSLTTTTTKNRNHKKKNQIQILQPRKTMNEMKNAKKKHQHQN